ncbi:hemocyanin-like [Schistocerca cancellata]|uniref:hemocyanin-like n=1 Tax=Schistocerca cancellata TaxID=274614 RepID=UPI00211781CF|nr:hemocyanin-like [Schistocerca cancellata]
MKLLLAVAALCACVVAVPVPEDKADGVFLKRQLLVLKLLKHIGQPVADPDLVSIKNSYVPLNNLEKYSDPEAVRRCCSYVSSGRSLARNAVFSLFDERHREEMVAVFEALYAARDFDALLGTAVFLRDRLNPRLFLYALSVALLHRRDCRGLTLPPAYEITPHMFLTTDVVRRAYQARMRLKPTIIPMKFTGSVNNPEQRVAYFGEDLGMNSHHQHWHMDFPFWWKPTYDQPKDRKGELFFYMHHQMTARFDAERLSNDLPPVRPLGWYQQIEEGFAPGAMYENGQEFPMRPDRVSFRDLPWLRISSMQAYEDRIRDAIAAGFVRTVPTGVLYLNETDGINVLGEIIESSRHSVNPLYYGQLHNDAHVLLSKIVDPDQRYGMPPGVMEHFETATRDPAFFRLHKHIDNLFYEHKNRLQPYRREELNFPGVQVEAVKVVGTCKASVPNLLVTYFDETHVDLGNAVESDYKTEVDIKAVVNRLNHEPFRYVITVRSEREVNGLVRIFLAPKLNWFGQQVPLKDLRWSTIELDKFPVKLRVGENVVVRSSEDSSVTIPEPRSFPDLVKDVQAAMRGEQEFVLDKYHRHCGFPHRLLLPKGKQEGMPYLLYVTVTDYQNDVVDDKVTPDDIESLTSLSYCGVLEGKIPDRRPLGFPFDRRIESVDEFMTPNSKVIEITIKNAK